MLVLLWHLPSLTPDTPALDSYCSRSCRDAALQAALLHVPPPPTCEPPGLATTDPAILLPLPCHHSSPSWSSSPVSSLSSSLFSGLFSGLSSCLLSPVPLSSSSIARLVPQRGMNSRRRLAWTHPGTGNPSSVCSVYELPARWTMWRGADHCGRSLRTVERVVERELSYT